MGLMRVLLVTTSFPSGPDDAAGPFVLRLMEALEEKDINCHVLTPASIVPTRWPDAAKVHRFRYASWRWQRLAQQPGGIPSALKKFPLLYALVPVFLGCLGGAIVRLARNVDVIHAQWSINGALAVLTCFIHKRPVITTLHGSDHVRGQGGGVYGWLHRKALMGSSHVVGVSEAITKSLMQSFPERPDKVVFIPNGVDEEFFNIRPEDRPAQLPLKLLFVGSLIPLKGVDVLLKAIPKFLKNSQVSVSLVGDGPEKENLLQLASQLKVESSIEFIGTVAPKDIPTLMAEHHILILPSQREGRPSVVLEAMAAAMAVVATDIDGTRELVKDGETGWLFPSGDDMALAQIIKSIQRGEKDIVSAGLSGRKWMEEKKLTWAETAEKYKKLYSEVISK